MNIDYKHHQLIISFPYSKDAVEMIKQLPDRRWDPNKKSWVIPAVLEHIEHLRSSYDKPIFLTAQAETWEAEAMTILRNIKHAQKFKHLTELPSDYTFKTKPFDHQVQCFNFFKQLNIGGLFLEMGLGKTKIVIDVVSYHHVMGKINKILYVCPNSVTENVKDEFTLHTHIKLETCILSGHKQKRIKGLQSDANVFIINYEGIKSLEKELTAAKFDCIICDESTRIKNPQAQCSKALHKLGRSAAYRYILTGTPITQSAIDIYSQYKFLEPSIFGPSYYAFRNRYSVLGGYLNKQIIGYRHLEELEKKLFQTAIRFTKTECLDLPAKVYEVKQFDLSKEERTMYNDIKEKIFIELEGQQVSAPLIITKLMKLTQICSGFLKTDSGEDKYFESSKLKLLKETLEDVLPKKVIIWCNFTANIQAISKTLRDMRVKHVTFSGKTKAEDRGSVIQEFQKDPDCQVFIGQIQTGGLGINLTAASYVIYYTNTYSLANRLQSEDRAHRIGQENKVTYIDLVARKTVEKSIQKALSKKLDLATSIIDTRRAKDIAEGEY